MTVIVPCMKIALIDYIYVYSLLDNNKNINCFYSGNRSDRNVLVCFFINDMKPRISDCCNRIPTLSTYRAYINWNSRKSLATLHSCNYACVCVSVLLSQPLYSAHYSIQFSFDSAFVHIIFCCSVLRGFLQIVFARGKKNTKKSKQSRHIQHHRKFQKN